MKKTLAEQIRDASSVIRLTNAERVRMRGALLARVHPEVKKREVVVPLLTKKPTASPITVDETTRTLLMPRVNTARSKSFQYKATPSPFGWLSNFRFVPATLAIFGMVGAGVTFAAEGALPGDTLYPVKVNVTEEVRGVFTFSKESEASWETRRAERRLEEAEKLAAEGRLSADTGSTLAGAFERHSNAARDSMAELETQNQSGAAVAIGSKFETALSAHEAILSHIVFGATPTDEERGAGEIVDKVRVKVGEVADARVRAGKVRVVEAAKVSTTLMMTSPASTSDDVVDASSTDQSEGDDSTDVAHSMKSAADLQIHSTEKTFNSITGSLDGDARTRIEAEISAVHKLFEDGNVALEAGTTAQAAGLFEEALSRSRKAELFMQAEMRLNVNLFRGGVIFFDTNTKSDSSVSEKAKKGE